MDTGRVSLPSIDSMLNTMSQLNYIQTSPPPQRAPLFTSDANTDTHSSNYYYQQNQIQQHPFVSLPCSSSFSSPLSTTWKGHPRSHSVDVNLAYSTTPSFSQQQQPMSSAELPLSPPPTTTTTTRLGSSVSPSHERSTRMSYLLTPPSASSSSSSSSSSIQPQQKQQLFTGSNDNSSHYHRHRPSHHHRSTSYTMGMNYNIIDNSNTLHYMTGDTPRKYLCPHCTKSFSRPSSLRTHIFSHSGEKPFACPYQGCDRSFSVQSNMRRHIRVHYSASLAVPSSHSS